MSLEDKIASKLDRLREESEKELQAEVDRNAVEEKRRRELSGSIKEFTSYLKKIEFPDLPLYVVAGTRRSLLATEYSYYRYVGNGWVFTLDNYDPDYDKFYCDQFLSIEGMLMQGSRSTTFFSSGPSRDGGRVGLPISDHLVSNFSKKEVRMVQSSLAVMEAVAYKVSDIIAKIIHSRPGMPPGCEPGVLGYLGSC